MSVGMGASVAVGGIDVSVDGTEVSVGMGVLVGGRSVSVAVGGISVAFAGHAIVDHHLPIKRRPMLQALPNAACC